MELDPLFTAMREAHPDVDLVILPPEQPEPPVDEATLAPSGSGPTRRWRAS